MNRREKNEIINPIDAISTGEIHIFPANFTRAEIDPELIVGADLEQEILASIEEAAVQGTRFFVIDNITFICNDSEKGATAGSFMMRLIRLKKKIWPHHSRHSPHSPKKSLGTSHPERPCRKCQTHQLLRCRHSPLPQCKRQQPPLSQAGKSPHRRIQIRCRERHHL